MIELDPSPRSNAALECHDVFALNRVRVRGGEGRDEDLVGLEKVVENLRAVKENEDWESAITIDSVDRDTELVR